LRVKILPENRPGRTWGGSQNRREIST
jgi:hypothetical protein